MTHMAKPRPGPAPRPLSIPRAAHLRHEVPGQARDGVILIAISALVLTSPATAQIIPTGTPAADILLSQAIAEHRVFLTCSALDPQTHQQIVANWQADVASAKAILAAHNVAPDAITAFTTAADPAALTPAPDTPWAEVQALCATRPDWQTDYFQLNLVILDLKLVGVLE